MKSSGSSKGTATIDKPHVHGLITTKNRISPSTEQLTMKHPPRKRRCTNTVTPSSSKIERHLSSSPCVVPAGSPTVNILPLAEK
mmetsp:Transcript_5335/g.14433  ORF Transcript_5335/g.14433 Transcript_5335/m.14433 type:complete len:84 (-) Transcript_5335:667-918(-)